jgi:hypothetical protein
LHTWAWAVNNSIEELMELAVEIKLQEVAFEL